MRGLPEDADPQITMLAEDLLNPTPKIEKIFSIKLPWEMFSPAGKMTDGEFKILLESVLCPTFNLIPSPKALNIALEREMRQLLREQYRILDFLEDQETAVINGATGTGKTMLAVEKARRHSENDEKVLFLCYNRMLCERLIEDYSKNKDKSYREQYKNVDFKTISQLVKDKTGNFKDISGFMDWLIDCTGDADKFGYKHVIIDEGQDFGLVDQSIGINSETAKEQCSIIDLIRDIVLDFGGTFYLFYDKYQMIQGGANADYCLPQCIEDSDCRLTLHCNCRNTKEIARTSVTPLRDKKNKAIKPVTAFSWFEPVKPKCILLRIKVALLMYWNKQ